ncbi:unnamed protein product [Rotaria sordida]|uniref:Uncharacterized protein n=1 Tax=Rotaria sordida TaxID=392033 RepID=A0A818LJ53_9BILA|nr:unnamed protein product [Rotaria sordida]CAF0828145.1 unnamed protein product [Rotaria sordida]CAF3499315.1 unnamed protein product [Rotaria sordida]CAF3578776.1 unnamed protein product [Rotaria sordida]
MIKGYTSTNATNSCWSTFDLSAEIIDESSHEFKIINGFASCKACFTTFVFRSSSKGTGTKNLTNHICSTKNVNRPTLHEIVKQRVQSLAEIAWPKVASRLAAAGSRDEHAFSLDL